LKIVICLTNNDALKALYNNGAIKQLFSLLVDPAACTNQFQAGEIQITRPLFMPLLVFVATLNHDASAFF